MNLDKPQGWIEERALPDWPLMLDVLKFPEVKAILELEPGPRVTIYDDAMTTLVDFATGRIELDPEEHALTVARCVAAIGFSDD